MLRTRLRSRVACILALLGAPCGAAPVAADPVASHAAPCTAAHPAIFDHVIVPPSLVPVIVMLLERSATFRRQCGRILAAADLTLVIREVYPLGRFPVRTTVRRAAGGPLWARIDLVLVPHQLAEWIGHEFEHVIEHVEGIDVRRRARRGDDAREVRAGLFETRRAVEAGARVARECHRCGGRVRVEQVERGEKVQ